MSAISGAEARCGGPWIVFPLRTFEIRPSVHAARVPPVDLADREEPTGWKE